LRWGNKSRILLHQSFVHLKHSIVESQIEVAD